VIVLRAVRVEDDGAEIELGEVRLTEVGVVYSHLSTAAGAGVIADLTNRYRAEVIFTPLTVEQIREAERTRRLGFDGGGERGEA
jgi:hypothetical protein